MNLTLTRLLDNGESTTGRLQAGPTTFYTIEQPWRNNEEGHSCVPVGNYLLIPYRSPVHGKTWCLHNPALNVYGSAPVPVGGRSFCEIHSGNVGEQLQGCVAIGLAGAPMLNPVTHIISPAVEDSRAAITELLQIVEPMSSGHTLTIANQVMSA